MKVIPIMNVNSAYLGSTNKNKGLKSYSYMSKFSFQPGQDQVHFSGTNGLGQQVFSEAEAIAKLKTMESGVFIKMNGVFVPESLKEFSKLVHNSTEFIMKAPKRLDNALASKAIRLGITPDAIFSLLNESKTEKVTMVTDDSSHVLCLPKDALHRSEALRIRLNGAYKSFINANKTVPDEEKPTFFFESAKTLVDNAKIPGFTLERIQFN